MADPRTLQAQQTQRNEKQQKNAHEAGCTCNACTGKTDAISDILQGKVAIEQAPKKTGHEPGCQCDACSGKTNAINDLLGEPVKLDAAPKMAGHDSGCQCDSCSGKTNSINDILTGAVQVSGAPKLAGHEPGCQCDSCSGKTNTVNDILKGNVIADSGPKMAGHEPGCQCASCTGKINAINDLLNGSVKVDTAPKMAGHEPGCQCDSCSGRTSTINALLFVPPKVDIPTAKEDVSTQPNANVQNSWVNTQVSSLSAMTNQSIYFQSNGGKYDDIRLKNGSSVQQLMGSSEMPVSDKQIARNAYESKTSSGSRASVHEPNQPIKDGKQFVIGNYTYMDILTIPWLRRQYGYMIGLGAEEENSSSIQNEKNKRATPHIIEPKKKHHQDGEFKGDCPPKTDQIIPRNKAESLEKQTEIDLESRSVHATSELSEKPSPINQLDAVPRKSNRTMTELEIKTEIVSLKMTLKKDPTPKELINAKIKVKTLEIDLNKAENEFKKALRLGLVPKHRIKLEKIKLQKLRSEFKLVKNEITLLKLKKEIIRKSALSERKIGQFVQKFIKYGKVDRKLLKAMKKNELKQLLRQLRSKQIVKLLLLRSKKKSGKKQRGSLLSGLVGQIKNLLNSL